jgi:sugar phosphate isomerase/epimerase
MSHKGQLGNQLAFFVAGVPELCPYLFSLLNPFGSVVVARQLKSWRAFFSITTGNYNVAIGNNVARLQLVHIIQQLVAMLVWLQRANITQRLVTFQVWLQQAHITQQLVTMLARLQLVHITQRLVTVRWGGIPSISC